MLDFKYKDSKKVAEWTTKEMFGYIYPEWINILAQSYRNSKNDSWTVRRAKAFCDLLDNVNPHLCPGELLVGSWIMINTEKGDEELLKINQNFYNENHGRDFTGSSDHHSINYYELLEKGIGGILKKAEKYYNYYTETDKKDFLYSVIIVLKGIQKHFLNWSEEILKSADDNPQYSKLLKIQSQMLKKLSYNPPETFWEAMQLITLINLNVFGCGLKWHMAFARLDQYMYPFYKKDIENNVLSEEEAQIITDHFFAKIADDNLQVRNIELGGITRDGENAVNPFTYVILESCKRIGKPGGNLTARIHTKNPDSYLKKCVQVIKTGIGYPSVYNDDLQIKALEKYNYSTEEARDYCQVGCIEVQMPGKQAPWSDSRFDTPKCINYVLRNGYNTIDKKYIGLRQFDRSLETWDDFLAALKEQISYCFLTEVTRVLDIKKKYDEDPDRYTSPLLSAFTDDCIARGLDICNGGAVYPGDHGIAVMGIGTMADSMMSIKKFIYDDKIWTLDDMVRMLDANFEGYEEEREKIIKEAPKYGNDIDEVDNLARDIAKYISDEAKKYKTPTGGKFLCLLSANVENVSSGKVTGATPDGRLAFEPLSDAASPTFGRDINGATASVKSISKIDYTDFPAGNVVNMRIDPSVLKGDKGEDSLVSLIRACFALGGMELQFNTNSKEILKDAIKHPENYENLVVRVSGFSANYTKLDIDVQKDILARTTHYSL